MAAPAGPIAEEALHGDEGDLAVGRAHEGEVGLFAEIEDVSVPDVHLDDAPAPDEGLREDRNLGHRPGSASRRGRQTRLQAAAATVKARLTRSTPRSIGRRIPATGFIQPNASSMRLRTRWLAA